MHVPGTEKGFRDTMDKLKGLSITRMLYKLGRPQVQQVFSQGVDSYEWREPSCHATFYVDRRTGTIIDYGYTGDCRAEEPPVWELVKEEEL